VASQGGGCRDAVDWTEVDNFGVARLSVVKRLTQHGFQPMGRNARTMGVAYHVTVSSVKAEIRLSPLHVIDVTKWAMLVAYIPLEKLLHRIVDGNKDHI
jgi:hypothetical protein